MSLGQAAAVPAVSATSSSSACVRPPLDTALGVARRDRPHQRAEGPRPRPERCPQGLLGSADRGHQAAACPHDSRGTTRATSFQAGDTWGLWLPLPGPLAPHVILGAAAAFPPLSGTRLNPVEDGVWLQTAHGQGVEPTRPSRGGSRAQSSSAGRRTPEAADPLALGPCACPCPVASWPWTAAREPDSSCIPSPVWPGRKRRTGGMVTN